MGASPSSILLKGLRSVLLRAGTSGALSDQRRSKAGWILAARKWVDDRIQLVTLKGSVLFQEENKIRCGLRRVLAQYDKATPQL